MINIKNNGFRWILVISVLLIISILIEFLRKIPYKYVVAGGLLLIILTLIFVKDAKQNNEVKKE